MSEHCDGLGLAIEPCSHPFGLLAYFAVHDDLALTASYALSPGISVDGLLEYSRYKSNDAAGPDYSGIGIGIGTAIAF